MTIGKKFLSNHKGTKYTKILFSLRVLCVFVVKIIYFEEKIKCPSIKALAQ